MKSFYCSLVLSLLTLFGSAQTFDTLALLPPVVNESSGLEVDSANSIWTHNDSDGPAELYHCDTLGNLLETITIEGAWNRDWEDITQDDQGHFYIGNIGNNNNTNTDLTIFKIPNPATADDGSVTAQVISFAYEDQFSFPPPEDSLYFDCEALFWWGGNLYFSTKNRTVPFDGKTHLYRIPDSPGNYTAEKIGTFDTGGDNMFLYWITAADVSPSGEKLVLLSSDKLWLFYGYQADDFFSGDHLQIDLPHSTQKEAICFVDENTLYISDEEWTNDIGRQLYRLDITGLPSNTQELPPAATLFQVNPNPTSGNVQIKSTEAGPWRIQVVNSQEKALFSRFFEQETTLDLTGLPSGLYYLVFKQGNRSITRKLIKK